MKPEIYNKGIIQKYNPSAVIFDLKECKTVLQCLNSSSPALSILRKEEGEDKVLALLEIWILDINEFFNVNNKMSPAQIKQTALMIIQDFYYFKIADLNLVFLNAKKGVFGNLYGSLDGSKIYQWFNSHDLDRSAECYLDKLREHDRELASERNAKSLIKTKIGKTE